MDQQLLGMDRWSLHVPEAVVNAANADAATAPSAAPEVKRAVEDVVPADAADAAAAADAAFKDAKPTFKFPVQPKAAAVPATAAVVPAKSTFEFKPRTVVAATQPATQPVVPGGVVKLGVAAKPFNPTSFADLSVSDVIKAKPTPLAPRTEIQTVDGQTTIYSSKVAWTDLQAMPNCVRIKQELIERVIEMGWVTPARIQGGALPLLLKLKPENMILQSQAGSGKTAAFAINLLSRIDVSSQWPQAIIVVPTSPLAEQSQRVIQEIGQHLSNFHVELQRGGDPDHKPKVGKDGKTLLGQVLVCTPGKLFEIVTAQATAEKNKDPRRAKLLFKLREIKVIVLDEADELLKADDKNDNGEQHVKDSLAVLKEYTQAQIVLVSATFNEKYLNFYKEFVPEPRNTILSNEAAKNDVLHFYYDAIAAPNHVTREGIALGILAVLFSGAEMNQVLVFAKDEQSVTYLCQQMIKDPISQAETNVMHRQVGLHVTAEGKKRDVAVQDQVLARFRIGKTRNLVCTDILADGMDFPDVHLVVQCNVPVEYKTNRAACKKYLQRSGRAGRYGTGGVSLMIVCSPEEEAARLEIVQYLADNGGVKMERYIEGGEGLKKFKSVKNFSSTN